MDFSKQVDSFSKQVGRDPSTPEHDKLMIALMSKDKWVSLISKYNLISEAYQPDTLIVEPEVPVVKVVYFSEFGKPSERYTIGFIDIAVWVDTGHYHATSINCEIKATEKSLGALLRQIKNYRAYADGRWVVVSPWSEWEEPLKSQGITWISTNEILGG